MTWFDAKDYCEGKGGKLVEIDSEEENRALVEEINRKRYTYRSMNFWIGLTDSKSEGDWRLASSGLRPSYLNWHEDQPDNKGGDEDCAQIRIVPYSFWKATWSDIDCNSTTAFPWINMHALCEFSPSKESPSTENPSTKSSTTKGASTKS